MSEVDPTHPPGDPALERESLPAPGTVLKDDYFARTSFQYVDGQPAILKESKPWRVLGLHLRLPARLLALHEAELNRRLSTIEGIPDFVRCEGKHRFARRFIAGRTLQDVASVSGTFFDELERIVQELHARGIAYVDLAKEENIIVGDDGRPYLIDFQISLCLGPFTGILKPIKKSLFGVLAREDLYHLAKHRSLKAPATLRFEHSYRLTSPSFLNRAHKGVVKTVYNFVTRRLLKRVRPR